MNSRLALLAALAGANVLLWGDRLLFSPLPTALDGAGLAQDLRRLWPAAQLADQPFPPSELYPPTHLHLLREGDRHGGEGSPANEQAAVLYSLFVGHYPRLGFLDLQPHDPIVCYQAIGYQIVDGPHEERIEADGALHAVQRIVVERRLAGGDGAVLAFTVLYWTQHGGALAGTAPGLPSSWERAVGRHAEARDDATWCRVEFRGRIGAPDTDTRARLVRMMHAVAAATRRPE